MRNTHRQILEHWAVNILPRIWVGCAAFTAQFFRPGDQICQGVWHSSSSTKIKNEQYSKTSSKSNTWRVTQLTLLRRPKRESAPWPHPAPCTCFLYGKKRIVIFMTLWYLLLFRGGIFTLDYSRTFFALFAMFGHCWIRRKGAATAGRQYCRHQFTSRLRNGPWCHIRLWSKSSRFYTAQEKFPTQKKVFFEK